MGLLQTLLATLQELSEQVKHQMLCLILASHIPLIMEIFLVILHRSLDLAPCTTLSQDDFSLIQAGKL